MHPARSLILFTAMSGLGFGLLAVLCLGRSGAEGWDALARFAAAFALAGGGLVASTFHLGHPERALKAFTQWRSSWLSREAWLACAALAVAALHAAGHLPGRAPSAPLGWLAALLSLATVLATSMIYAQLRTVPRWRHWTTPAVFAGLALGGGALLAGSALAASMLLAATAAAQAYAWLRGDRALADSGTDLASATGLGGGRVRAFEPPHTGGNYLTREMVHVVARRHARKLRAIAMALCFVLPALLPLAPAAAPLLPVAAASHVAGLLVLRWLFFAEAEHVVGLYYGRR